MMHSARYQACDLNFKERTGNSVMAFKAHFLRPIAALKEGVAVTYDVAAGFAVRYANCHRTAGGESFQPSMPSDQSALLQLILPVSLPQATV